MSLYHWWQVEYAPAIDRRLRSYRNVVVNFLFFNDDPQATRLLNLSYSRLFTNDLLFNRSYVTIANAPARLDEARLFRLIVKRFADRAHAFAQGVVVDVFSVPETIQQFGATYDSIAVLDQIG